MAGRRSVFGSYRPVPSSESGGEFRPTGSLESLRLRAFQFLVLYVGMFTLPIAVLTLVAYAGVSSEGLVSAARAHTAAVKLGMAGLFLLLTAYLGSTSLQLFL